MQGEPHIDYDSFRISKSGVSYKKMIEELLNNYYVYTFMSTLQVSLNMLIASLYIFRTYNMCLFDKEPLWVQAGKQIVLDGECYGEHHDWYYPLLLVTHSYFTFDFILRVIIQDFMLKYLTSSESLLEICTTFPFLITYSLYGPKNSVVQFLIMMDLLRLLLLIRFTKLFESEINREAAGIILSILSYCIIMSAFT